MDRFLVTLAPLVLATGCTAPPPPMAPPGRPKPLFGPSTKSSRRSGRRSRLAPVLLQERDLQVQVPLDDCHDAVADLVVVAEPDQGLALGLEHFEPQAAVDRRELALLRKQHRLILHHQLVQPP